MKERNGFVSNSSSSSFLIYGVSIDESKMIDLYNAINGSSETDAYDVSENISGETKIRSHNPSESSYYYFGVSPKEIRDDETGAQFKARVETQLEKYFPNKSLFGYHSEAWYNG